MKTSNAIGAMWRVPYVGSVAMVLCVAASCGGRLDIAEVDRDQETGAALRGRVDESPVPAAVQTSPALGSDEPSIVPVDPLPNEMTEQELIVDPDAPAAPTTLGRSPECFDEALDPFWGAPPGGGIWLLPLPTTGCEYAVEGDDEECTGTWTCCGVEYEVRFSKTAGQVSTTWRLPPLILGPSDMNVSGPDDGQTCPLFGLDAPSVAAEGYHYSPAWDEAVREALDETEDAPEPDPIPLGCTFVSLGDCNARLDCPEHSYYAGFDEDGEVECERDDEIVEPVTERDQGESCYQPFASLVPANHCFGEGWSSYFQVAAEGPRDE